MVRKLYTIEYCSIDVEATENSCEITEDHSKNNMLATFDLISEQLKLFVKPKKTPNMF